MFAALVIHGERRSFMSSLMRLAVDGIIAESRGNNERFADDESADVACSFCLSRIRLRDDLPAGRQAGGLGGRGRGYFAG